jgi:hypothetical protein
MPLEATSEPIRLIGTCGAEDALELVDALSNPAPHSVDLSACTNLHPALLQTLLTFKPAIAGEPTDPFLVRWVLPMLTADRDSAQEKPLS